ncbi:MAG TPA: FAD:protein FMN transferase [Gaiellaceae bacterium]|nr:FAD:protein FMN transferase [Gaiellaceae bacterium]
MTVSFPALGTTATLSVVDPERVTEARAALEHELSLVDAACSRFRGDSELARVNAASGRRVAIGAYLAEALHAALRAAAMTSGLVDPTVGRSLRLAGYDATFQLVRARDGATFRPQFERAAGWGSIELDDAQRTVRLPPGVELDLGATAKAFAADRAACAAADAAGCGVLVSLGGDIAVAGDGPAGGWPIGVGDDHAAGSDCCIAVETGGVATSSITVRRWRAGDAELHHVIDPRTGRSADTRWRTVTVAAASCLDANIAATAALLLDDAAPGWLAARALPARLVARDGTVERSTGWPEAA